MSGLVGYVRDELNAWVEAGARVGDVTGSPVSSAIPLYDGRGISDDYRLTFSSVIPGVSALVSVTPSPTNPYTSTSNAVALNGSTQYDNLIPGVRLIFSDSGSFSDSWSAVVHLGVFFGVHNAFSPDSGTPGDSVMIRVVNTGSRDGLNCSVRLLPVVKRVLKTGTVFDSTRGAAEFAIEKLVSDSVAPYAVTATGVIGSGPSKTADLDIDGDQFGIINQTTLVSGSSVELTVVDQYLVTSGPLTGLKFQLSQAIVNSDTENVLVFSPRFAQVAPDEDGVPGDWGILDVDLTEDGQDTGTISAGGHAHFHARVLVPGGGNSTSNPHPLDFALQGSAVAAAGWGD